MTSGALPRPDAPAGASPVQRMVAEGRMRHVLGGLGKYPTTSTHGPFVHVDTRGHRARW